MIKGSIRQVKTTNKWCIGSFDNKIVANYTISSPPFSLITMDWFGEQKISYTMTLSKPMNLPWSFYITFAELRFDTKLKCSCYILNSKNEKVVVFESFYRTFNQGVNSWKINSFFTKEQVESGLIPDNLMIITEVILDPIINNSIINEKQCFRSNKMELYNQFEKFLDNGQYSDVTIQVSEKVFYAHKIILALKSAVFAAMFENATKESKENKVVVKDVSPNIFKELLRYMYIQKVENIEAIVDELLVAADVYLLQDLKDLCSRSIEEKLSKENALHYIQASETFQLPTLKAKAIEIILTNIKSYAKEPEFETMLKNVHSDVACKIIRCLALPTEI